MAKNDLKNEVERLARLVERMTVPIPSLPQVPSPSTDHDTLVAFRAETVSELKNIRADIATLNDGTTKTLTDHENRLKGLEITTTKIMSYGTALVFIIGIAEFLISKLF